jgi:hypothetical protein
MPLIVSELFLNRDNTTHMEVYLLVDFDKMFTRMWCSHDVKLQKARKQNTVNGHMSCPGVERTRAQL